MKMLFKLLHWLLVWLCIRVGAEATLLYQNLSAPGALCNDFTRAGLFKQLFPSSNKWIIFFESGGFCYSAESCNRRFFHPSLRTNSALDSELSGQDFDPADVWSRNKDRDLSRVVSPLMTSIYRFRDQFSLGRLIVDGTDLLSRNCEDNPVFCEFNFVLVPYCSSDLWLGNDNRHFEEESEDFFYSSHYQSDSKSLQFLFRGAVIFRSAITDLLLSFGTRAEEIVIAGSSAGGVGVLNHMVWVQDTLRANSISAQLSTIVDSSWFINFRGDLENLFQPDGGTPPSDTGSPTTRETLLDLVSWHEPCMDIESSGIPCCLTAHCILSNPNYFPDKVPVFAIISLYDVFVLGASLRGLVILSSEQQALDPGYAFDFVRTIAEYGGEMNRTIAEVTSQNKYLSTYVTGCFQHIYLATSTLWGEPEKSLFGRSLVEFASSFAAIRHSIKSGVWNSFKLNPSSGRGFSIEEAIQQWYPVKSNQSLHFRDGCQGPHCNDACPEMFVLNDLVSNIWQESGKGLLILIVSSIAVACLVLKAVFTIWLWRLEYYQQLYLGLLGDQSRTTDIETALQFPDCSDNDAVSIACLDLSYKIKISQQMKDEKKDNLTPMVLGELNTTEEDLEYSSDKHEHSEIYGSSTGTNCGEGGMQNCSQEQENRPTKHQLLQRARTRRTLQETYRTYRGGGSDSGGLSDSFSKQPEAIQRIRSIARRTFRGSRRLHQQPSVLFSEELIRSSSPDEISLNIRKSPEPYDEVNSSTRNYYDSQNLSYGNRVIENDKKEDILSTGGDLDLLSVQTQRSTTRKGSHFSSNLKELVVQQRNSLSVKYRSRKYKDILKGISLYFNPGELIGIMGPSGCGKTTFLDLLTGRRNTGTTKGHIYINGTRMDEVRDWYISNTGYVLQLANPYYEELTVRENLTLAAQIKLSKQFSLREKFQRVEQVMFVSGLLEFAETTVGGSTGPGLSGGQKRRLAVALQLLKLPNVIFLDEPTSGLDAASSFELLTHLNKLADSNRTIILTIHQPRLEIFHMFTRLVLLCDGKVAYHGVPDKAYEVFVTALKSRYLEQGLIIPELEDHNPADVIMDILGNSSMRQIITDYYQASDEPKYVWEAINAVATHEVKTGGTFARNLSRHVSYAMYGARKVQHKHAETFSRLAALEARASRRLTWMQSFYLPIIFFAYGVLLGTAYFQQDAPLLVMSGFCVYSVASALFMFPILYNYYSRALQVYSYEHGDGVGNAYDLILQGFVHAVSMSIFPVIICAGILYLLLVNSSSYNGSIYGQLVVVNLVLNQCWIALLIALICAFPVRAFRLSPVISSVAGFTSGFFIPIQEMHWGYRWLFYINPNYYGFSASAYLLLADFKTSCAGSEFECYTSSGEYILRQFNFHNVNPYLHIMILLIFTVFFILLAVFSHWIRHSNITSDIARLKVLIKPTFWPTSDNMSTSNEDVTVDDDELVLVDDEIQKIDESKFEGQTEVGEETEEEERYEENPVDVVAESQEIVKVSSREEDEEKEIELENLSTIVEETSEKMDRSGVLMDDFSLPQQRPRAMTDVVSQRPLQLVKTSSDSRLKKAGILQALDQRQHQDMLSCSVGSSKNFSTMIRTRPSAFLNAGEQHKVWRPTPQLPSPVSASRPHSKLLPQKSKQHLLADRKKILDNRLQATREALKMQNMEEAQKTAAACCVQGAKPSFSDVSQRVKSNIAFKKKNMEFHTIVDRYVAMMAKKDKAPPTTTPTTTATGSTMGGATDSIKSAATPKTQTGTGHQLKFKYTSSPQSIAAPLPLKLSSSVGSSRPGFLKQAVRASRPIASPLPKRKFNPPVKVTHAGAIDTEPSKEDSPAAPIRPAALSKTIAPVSRVQSSGAIPTKTEEETSSINADSTSLPV